MQLKSQSENYRNEIDGIRAFAVIAVLINHINPQILPSGYLGVDIFFVISGFVITSSLTKHKFSSFSIFIVNFYSRRLKRLIPALVVCIVITGFLVTLITPYPGIYLSTGLFGLFGFSNNYLLLRSTDYFSHSAEMNPFTHTWSLGIEEQFYFIFPLILWFTGFARGANKLRRKGLLIIIFLMAGSYGFYVSQYFVNPSASYFLMPSRFWELSAGCLLFIYSSIYTEKFKVKISSIFILVSLIVILFLPAKSIVITTSFVVLLTCLLINCLTPNDISYNLLSWSPLRYIGLISYSLYLWHWPVIVLSKWTIGLNRFTLIPILILILVLAICSYHLLEFPLRKRQWSATNLLTIIKAFLVSVFAAIVLVTIAKGKTFIFAGTSDGFRHSYPSCDNNPSSSIWIIGDSHAQELQKAIAKNTNKNCFLYDIGLVEAKASIHSQGWDNIQNKPVKRDIYLPNENSNYAELIKEHKPNIVFINIYWTGMFFPSLALPSWDGVWREFYKADSSSGLILINSYEAFDSYISALAKLFELSRSTRYIFVRPEPEFNWINNGGVLSEWCTPQWYNLYRGTPGFKDLCDAATKIEEVDLQEHYRRSSLINSKIDYFIKYGSENNINIAAFDPAEYLCYNDKCSTHVRVEGVDRQLYRDDDHIGHEAIEILSSPLKNIIQKHYRKLK